jgi:hypothetical protein
MDICGIPIVLVIFILLYYIKKVLSPADLTSGAKVPGSRTAGGFWWV